MWRLLSLLLAFAVPVPALAQTEVDVELFLAVDVSRSMAPAELEIQRRGYAEALRSTEVITAIEGGLIGQIALTYVEWAGTGSQRVVVPWTIIGTAAEARAFADRIEAHFDPSLRRTSISGALLYAAESIETNEFLGLRRVIDVSGDGPNNHGRPVTRARDAVIARGITINGLPLMTSDRAGARWHLDDLDAYYTSMRDRRSRRLRPARPFLGSVRPCGPPQAGDGNRGPHPARLTPAHPHGPDRPRLRSRRHRHRL